MAQPSKIILVFCDGTGLDGVLGSLTVTYSGVSAGGVARKTCYQCTTSIPALDNIFAVARTVKQYREAKKDKNGAVVAPRIPQIVLYQSGVGSQTGFEPQTAIDHALSGGAGEEYNKALGHFVDIPGGSRITVRRIPSSSDILRLRGAYTARKVAGLIDRIGILSGPDLYKLSEKLLDKGDIPGHTPVKVKCVGVWDTVGSIKRVQVTLGNPVVTVLDAFSICDATLPDNVEHAYHAVSLQENRSNFLPTLWKDIKKPAQVLEQVWFLGDHGDVGGGHQNLDLSDISLVWMAEKIREFVDLDTKILDYYIDRSRRAGWGESQPNNAFLSLPRSVRLPLFVTQKRDRLWTDRQDVLAHPSCGKAVDPIRDYEILRPKRDLKGFSTPDPATLKGFEEKLHKKWKAKSMPAIKPDISEDATAIGLDKAKRGASNFLDGEIVDGAIQVADGVLEIGMGLVGEAASGVSNFFSG
ncbi:hypothetical protein B0H17DRAFT_1179164 [Mycena rosella]|uniref:T6SS Phospholipase effector Tle1-like catalytic domain-containing protein n=1 Tax=Mycena rosella TaxID=1033263 RepID=A0AAD7GG61_MYCRO|nr:hypothetical protein B0H17DRAFT_1179164 [Mycena rosella]